MSALPTQLGKPTLAILPRVVEWLYRQVDVWAEDDLRARTVKWLYARRTHRLAVGAFWTTVEATRPQFGTGPPVVI